MLDRNLECPNVAVPGPGVWQLDASHFSRPLTRFFQPWYPQAFEEGQALSLPRYGAPIKTVMMRVVDGFVYIQPEPLAGPPGAPPPPKWLFVCLSRVLPAFRRCARAAQKAVDNKIWREDARRWSEEVWPSLEGRILALQDEPLKPLDDAALLEHLERARLLQIDSIHAHFDTSGATIVPCGLFAHHVRQWTDVEPAEILAVLRGTSPVLCAERSLLDELRALLRPDDLQGASAEVLTRLRSRADTVGHKTRAWLQRVEHRQIFAGDVYLPTNAELPHLLVEQLRTLPREPHTTAASVDALRAKVPGEHRARFDALLEEARATAYLRDERSALNDAWVGGMMRRALLEVGRRLHERNRLPQAADVVHLTPTECATLLLKGEGPNQETISAYARAQTRSSECMPPFLGGAQPPETDFSLLPGALGELMPAILTYVDLMEGDLQEAVSDELRGIAASAGEYIGVARVVNGPEDFHRVQSGDVLIARTTMPSYNGAMAVAGAVVTDRGGALSHAAIVSRELGIPAVVSTKVGTMRIPDGSRVRVNGTKGEVEVLP